MYELSCSFTAKREKTMKYKREKNFTRNIYKTKNYNPTITHSN